MKLSSEEISYMEETKQKTIVLCNPSNICPQVHFFSDEDRVEIADDYGGVVKLTREQFKLLQNAKEEDAK